MGFFLKLRLLLWKNFLIRRRNKYRAILEMAYPLLLFGILLILKPSENPTSHYPECHFREKAMPSAGQVPFLHSFVCRADFVCYDKNGSIAPPPGALRAGRSRRAGVNDFDPLGLCGNSNSSQPVTRDFPRRRLARSPYERVVDMDEPSECHDVENALLTLGQSPFLTWRVVKPFIRGKILYYPDTEATRSIMQRVNKTFNQVTTFPKIDLNGSPAVTVKELLGSEIGRRVLKVAARLNGNDVLAEIANRNGSITDETLSSLDPGSIESLDRIIASFDNFEKCVNRQKVEPVAVESAVKEAWRQMRTNNLWALVVFEDAGEERLSPFVKYNIRMSADRNPGDGIVYTNSRLGQQEYIQFGFSYLQDLVDSAILEVHTGRAGAERPGRILQPFPIPSQNVDNLLTMVMQLMPLMMVLAWIYPFSQTAKSVVLEKEEGVKEVLAVMGLGRGVQWCGWVLEGLLSATITCTVLSIMLKYGRLIEYSDLSLIFVLLISSVVAWLSFSLLVSSFFTRATLAGPAASVIYFLTYLAYQLVENSGGHEPSSFRIFAASLLSNVAFAEASLTMGTFELNGEGMKWNNIFIRADPDSPTTIASSLAMLWLDAAIYAVLTWYIEAVFPGEYGVPKPYLFFLEKSYWFGTTPAEEPNREWADSDAHVNSDNFEPAPEDAIVGVAIDKLTKTFGKKTAVHNLNLNFYQDQINAFLGHNGAGKTTSISMLTGLYTPSSGTARLYGQDIRTDMDAIRASMGVCPQHNVLFKNLTVEEHLIFFGRIKRADTDGLRAEIDDMLREMGLEEKRHAFPNTLSGGMKRKLSVGMAFVGGSRVVFLDEPTAGVDPFSRRGIWDLLVRLRKGRTIILTTHFMDEAELLGDRIAIMVDGSLECCGSSVFLKERLGSGYHLTIEWQQQENEHDTITSRAMVQQEVLSCAPAALPAHVTDSETMYVLPNRHDIAALTTLLERLDARRIELGIASYAVSDTALEEIFLTVNKRKVPEESKSDVVSLTDDDHSGELLVNALSGWQLIKQQYVALVKKRFHYVRRDWKGMFTQLVLPAFFVTLSLALSSSGGKTSGELAVVVMRTDTMAQPVVGFVQQLQSSLNWGRLYSESMLKDGLGSELVGQNEKKPLPAVAYSNKTCTKSPPATAAVTALLQLPSGELYYNVTGVDALEDWLIDTNSDCWRNRFGGVSFGASYSLEQTIPDDSRQADNVKIWFDGRNGRRPTTAPAYLNTINNVLLRASLPNPPPGNHKTRDFGIEVSSWPLPEETATNDTATIQSPETTKILLSAITVIFAMSFVPATFVMFIVEERVAQSKHLQLVSGLRPYVYWLQNYTWDLVSFGGSEVLVILIYVAYQIPLYTSGSNSIALIILIFLYGLSCTPMLYLFSWGFRIPSMAFLVLSTGNLLLGMVTTISISIVTVTRPDIVHYIENGFLVLPQYCLGKGLMNMASNYLQNQFQHLGGKEETSPLNWEVTGKFMVAMAGTSVVLVMLVFMAEQSTHWWHGWQQYSQTTDTSVGGDHDKEDDVRREEQRVAANLTDNSMLVLNRITKRYKRKGPLAVNKVSLGVERGQCFGLLGLNGAGKSSIFKMLTGDTLISGGDALVAGHSVRGDMDSVRRLTGYCPQFDALLPLLTVKEHLNLYCSLRGVPENQRSHAVRRAIQMMDLMPHQDKLSKTLSGGNKRKLSAAIALVGNPALLYMDEPTTSMDPCARRFVWQRVRDVVSTGRSVVLTSHSMEECESLCGRITIMVNGRLTCIGSLQHLKQKYGSGYIALVRCPMHRVLEARETLRQSLKDGTIIEANLHQFKLQFPPELSLVTIFRTLEQARISGCVRDYSVSQTTLEDVFMRFARAQKNVD